MKKIIFSALLVSNLFALDSKECKMLYDNVLQISEEMQDFDNPRYLLEVTTDLDNKLVMIRSECNPTAEFKSDLDLAIKENREIIELSKVMIKVEDCRK